MTEWLLTQPENVIYIGLFLLLLSGALGFPPEDVSLLLGGICIQHQRGDPLYIFLICYLGTVLGDIFIYFVGRRYGPSIFTKKWFQKRLHPARIRWVRRGLEKRALPTIFVARHLFYLRTLTFLTCGAVKMGFSRFLFADAFSALVSVPIMLSLGYIASNNYETVIAFIAKAKILSLVLILLMLVGAVWYFVSQRIEEEGKKSDDEKA